MSDQAQNAPVAPNAPTSAEAAVSLDRVRKAYDGRAVLRDLSLTVGRGEFLAILGPSGSGKTTVMRLIGGFEAPDAGRVLIAGADVTALPPEDRRVNTVFQSYALFPHMTVLDNVAFGPRMRGLDRRARRRKAGEMLDLVRLTPAAGRYPHQLSGGMQQRVALARALANDPEVLLLDEPLGALDRALREDMSRELRRVQSELGATFVYVTHDQEEAFAMADRLAVMRAGRFEQIDAPAAVYDAPANGWIAGFVGDANRIAAKVATIVGATAHLQGPDGMIEATLGTRDLDPGEAATVAIRPEATRLLSAAPAGPNVFAARLTDRQAIGPNLRLSARTEAGAAIEALISRADPAAGDAPSTPGAAVWATFAPAAARAYRQDDHDPGRASARSA